MSAPRWLMALLTLAAVIIGATLVIRAAMATSPAPVGLQTPRVATVSPPRPSAAPKTPTEAPKTPTEAPKTPTPVSAAPEPRRILAFGDSVAAGSKCSCTPFPATYAALVAAHSGSPVTSTNVGMPGGVSATVRAQIESPKVQSMIRTADTVLVMIGANDAAATFERASSGSCALPACATSTTGQIHDNVAAAIRRIRAVHGSPVGVVVLGYWNVVKDGDVGRREYGAVGLAQALSLTVSVNDALKGAASETGSQFVSTWEPFEGAAGELDPTDLLADDGDHPNALGHRRIAQALFDALPGG